MKKRQAEGGNPAVRPEAYRAALDELGAAVREAAELAEALESFAAVLRGGRRALEVPEAYPGEGQVRRVLERRARALQAAEREWRLLPQGAQEWLLPPEELLGGE